MRGLYLLKKIIKHSFTCKDNKTYDIGRILWAFCILAYISIDCYSVYKGQDFAEMDFGIGLSTLLASGGFGIAIKRKSEPGEGEDEKDEPK